MFHTSVILVAFLFCTHSFPSQCEISKEGKVWLDSYSHHKKSTGTNIYTPGSTCSIPLFLVFFTSFFFLWCSLFFSFDLPSPSWSSTSSTSRERETSCTSRTACWPSTARPCRRGWETLSPRTCCRSKWPGYRRSSRKTFNRGPCRSTFFFFYAHASSSTHQTPSRPARRLSRAGVGQ